MVPGGEVGGVPGGGHVPGELELAWDRPFEEWPRYGSENPAFLDAPLDIDELLTVARDPSDTPT